MWYAIIRNPQLQIELEPVVRAPVPTSEISFLVQTDCATEDVQGVVVNIPNNGPTFWQFSFIEFAPLYCKPAV